MGVFREESEQKFISVYQSHVDEIYQYVYMRTGLNQTISEDITQEIFMDIYKGIANFKGLCSERTWIYKITKNKINDFYRKQYKNKFKQCEIENDFVENIVDPSQDLQEIMIKSFERKKVEHCLRNLPDTYKIVLVLKYIDDKSVKEIASIVGKSTKAIESMLQRAKSSFIKMYRKYDEEEGL